MLKVHDLLIQHINLLITLSYKILLKGAEGFPNLTREFVPKKSERSIRKEKYILRGMVGEPFSTLHASASEQKFTTAHMITVQTGHILTEKRRHANHAKTQSR